MARFRINTAINAPPEVCFDLARDIDFHTRSLSHTGERAIAGRTTGLIDLGESVTWEARHLGIRQQLTSKVTAFDRPTYFRDEMTRGAGFLPRYLPRVLENRCESIKRVAEAVARRHP